MALRDVMRLQKLGDQLMLTNCVRKIVLPDILINQEAQEAPCIGETRLDVLIKEFA